MAFLDGAPVLYGNGSLGSYVYDPLTTTTYVGMTLKSAGHWFGDAPWLTTADGDTSWGTTEYGYNIAWQVNAGTVITGDLTLNFQYRNNLSSFRPWIRVIDLAYHGPNALDWGDATDPDLLGEFHLDDRIGYDWSTDTVTIPFSQHLADVIAAGNCVIVVVGSATDVSYIGPDAPMGSTTPPDPTPATLGFATLVRPLFWGSIALQKTRQITRTDVFDLAYFSGSIRLPQPVVAQRDLTGIGLFTGSIDVRRFTPYGAFRDFAFYDNGIPDPAMALVTGEASGLSTFDVSTPSNMRRIWVDVAAPREYRTTTEPYAWPRAAFASVGVRVNDLHAAEYQYVDAAQIENKPLARTGPTDYAPARAVHVNVRPDRLNYQRFPIGDACDTWAGWMCSGGDLSVPSTGFIRATVSDDAPVDMNVIVEQPPGSNPVVSGGRVYTFSVQARGQLPLRMRVSFFREFLDGSTTIIGAPIDGKVLTPGRNFVGLPPITTFVPPEAKYADVSIGIAGTGPRPVGSTFDVRYSLAEPGNAVKPFFDGNSGIDYLWEQGTTAYSADGSRSYYYRDRTARAYLLGRVLAENCPIGITPAVPQFAVFPDA